MRDDRGIDRATGMDRRHFVSACLRGALVLPLLAPALGALACGGEEAEPPGTGPTAGGGPAKPPPAPTGGKPEAAKPAPAPPMPAAGGGSAGDELVTEIPTMRSVVQSLQYVNQSTKPDQRCSNCQFYTAAGSDRGKCQLFTQGLVNSGGWCASWVKKAT